MILGGNTTVYVADINASILFYTQSLGLKLRMRAGDDWAEIDAGPGLMIGLHPADPAHSPKPGTPGSVTIGFNVTEDLEAEVARLKSKGVRFQGPLVEDEHVRLAFFNDPDGNPFYLSEVLHVGAHGAPES